MILRLSTLKNKRTFLLFHVAALYGWGMLDPHRLRIFRSVVTSGSIQAAARNLGYTPSAVSQHVAALQREVGLSLIEKSGRGIVATPAGLALAAESEEVIASLTRLGNVVDDLREGRTARLTMGYFASAGFAWMPRLARILMEEFPHLVLELSLNDIANGPERRPADLDLVAESPHRSDTPPTGYRRRHLLDDIYVAVVPDGHPLAARQSIALAELRDESWVDADAPEGECHITVARACAAAGYVARYGVQTQDHYTAMAFVAQGVGVAVVPRLAIADPPPGVRTLQLVDPEPVRKISLLVRESSAAYPAITRAVELFDDLASDPYANFPGYEAARAAG
jgi:DNA-binding transcriptional LysR family regulator